MGTLEQQLNKCKVILDEFPDYISFEVDDGYAYESMGCSHGDLLMFNEFTLNVPPFVIVLIEAYHKLWNIWRKNVPRRTA